MTRLKTPREMDRDGRIRPAVFECINCGVDVSDPIQFIDLVESDDVLGQIMFKVSKEKGLK